MTVTVKTNLPQFRAEMDRIGRDFIPMARTAARAAAVEFAKAVRRFAPKDSGRLRRAVIIKRARRVPRGTVHYIVGIRQGVSQQRIKRMRKGAKVDVNLDAFYWRFLEGGWVPRGPGNRIKGGTRRRRLERDRLISQGARFVKKPFIGPAFTTSSERALRTFYDTLSERVSRIK